MTGPAFADSHLSVRSIGRGLQGALAGIVGREVAAELGEESVLPAPRCYRKVTVEAVYETSERLLRKARLVHDEAENGQITLTHYPAIYIEEKTLVSPEYVVLKEVACTRRVLRKAQELPDASCDPLRGCTEIEPATDD